MYQFISLFCILTFECLHFMNLAVLLLLNFRCVALFNALFAIQHIMLRKPELNPPEAEATSAEQRCERRLKKSFLHNTLKYQWLLIVREQQIYGFDRYMSGQNLYFANP